jgi:hypothetical protein
MCATASESSEKQCLRGEVWRCQHCFSEDYEAVAHPQAWEVALPVLFVKSARPMMVALVREIVDDLRQSHLFTVIAPWPR